MSMLLKDLSSKIGNAACAKGDQQAYRCFSGNRPSRSFWVFFGLVTVCALIAASKPGPKVDSHNTVASATSQSENRDFLTKVPTLSPTEGQAEAPSNASPVTPKPTRMPSPSPTNPPTGHPTNSPTRFPTISPTSQPTALPTSELTYQPGNLTTMKEGLLLSQGLDARLIAITDQVVPYDFGGQSDEVFHGQPDAGATFADSRPNNPGGWIYVSNSEVDDDLGGVGAITFDKDGNVVDYQRVLNGTTHNCGGGRTPWGTWASCEEKDSEDGLVYQVDPTGQRSPEAMTVGSVGGRWESFAYDVRDTQTPQFFVTEDHKKGALLRFIPTDPDWDDPWAMLHGIGTTQYLMVYPNEALDGGTYGWTSDRNEARNNARAFYPDTEGIDVYKNELYFTCKKIKVLFVLDLDSNSYRNQTTVSGLFDGQPDQLQRVLGDSTDLLYFTEEGGVDAGIHARDSTGQFYTILESPVYVDETTGLSFSPDGRFMYTAYQENGLLFAVWRKDGRPFQEAHLDVKFHHPTADS